MADILMKLQKDGILKQVIHGGTGEIPAYRDGAKLFFHYRTCLCDEDKTVLDDSRKHTKPMELILGKKFKLEVWETCLTTMKVGEVANFIVETKHVGCYPLVAKSLREVFGPKDKHHDHEHKDHHCCGMMALAEQGVGHEDLDKLIKNPQPLMFTLEMLKVEEAGSYEKEAWVMTEDEKITAIPRLREEGNTLYSQKKFEEASEKYSSALGMLEQLVLREKPGDEEWERLEDMKTPLLLNFSQCKLTLKDYYPVIEHTSTVLKRDPDNVKALFRRAKAHVGAWNPEEAKEDFERVMELKPSLTNSVTKELKLLEQIKKQKDSEDKQKLKGLFS